MWQSVPHKIQSFKGVVQFYLPGILLLTAACQGTSDQTLFNVNAPFVPQVVKILSATSLGAFDDQLITNQGAARTADLLADSAIWLTCLISIWVMMLFWPVSRITARSRTSNATGAFPNCVTMFVSYHIVCPVSLEYKMVDPMVPRQKSLWGRFMKRVGLVSWSLLLATTLLVSMSTTAEAGCCCHAELNSCCELRARQVGPYTVCYCRRL